jgi:hypothetical protein
MGSQSMSPLRSAYSFYFIDVLGIYCRWPGGWRRIRETSFRLGTAILLGKMPLPIACEVHRLAALQRQMGYAVYLIAIRDAAVVFPP